MPTWSDDPFREAEGRNDRVTHTGIGIAFDDDGGVYFTQLFLRPR